MTKIKQATAAVQSWSRWNGQAERRRAAGKDASWPQSQADRELAKLADLCKFKRVRQVLAECKALVTVEAFAADNNLNTEADVRAFLRS